MIEKRYDVINFLSDTYYNGKATYLEIGVEYPQSCFDRVRAIEKTSVDPSKIDINTHIDYIMTSDKFFEKLERGLTEFSPEYKWDIIFIDGLHLAEQVWRDIQNAISHCSGFVLLHDCFPPNFWNAHSDYEYFLHNSHEWNGSTWKAFYKYRTTTPFQTYTVNTDYGIGVIDCTKPGNAISFDNIWFEYGRMKSNVKHDLGLLSVDEFVRMHSKKTNQDWWSWSQKGI